LDSAIVTSAAASKSNPSIAEVGSVVSCGNGLQAAFGGGLRLAARLMSGGLAEGDPMMLPKLNLTESIQMNAKKMVRMTSTKCCLWLALLAAVPQARAQTFQYWSLPAGNGGPNPYAKVIQASDGYFYGTLPGSGSSGNGQIFKVDTNGNFTFDLVDFGSPYGTQPQGPLIQARDGNFYGTTLLGPTGGGTIFKMDTNYNLTTLKSFGYADNYLPYAGLVQGMDGLLYGVTYGGGAAYSCYQYDPSPYNGYGTVYRSDTNGDVTNLVVFTGTNAMVQTNLQAFCNDTNGIADGESPYYAELVQASNGYFYGTTYAGGTNGLGTVFKMDTNGLVTTLAEFNGVNGEYPLRGLIQAIDGNLYGTTISGGLYNDGTVYKIAEPGDTFTNLVSFNGSSTQGSGQYSGLMQGKDGLLYGQSEVGGSIGVGEVFAVDFYGNVTRVWSYDQAGGFPSSGYYPLAPLTQGSDGNIYGICTYGGANGGGIFFQIAPVPPTLTSAICPVTNNSEVTVVFSESVRSVSELNPANYTVNYGGPVVSVISNSPTQVTLQITSALSLVNSNVLTVNNVISTVGALPIATNSQLAINTPSPTIRLEYNQGGTNNLVSLEAEDYDLNVMPNTSHYWSFTTSPIEVQPGDTNTIFSGTGVMEADPEDTGTTGTTTSIGGAPSGGRLDYMVRFDTAGTFYVWVRGAGDGPPNGPGDSDSVSIGLDGGLTTRIAGFPLGEGYCWTNEQTGTSTNIIIETPGLHVINVWVRQDSFAFDKFLLTDNTNYVPTGFGPAESAPTVGAAVTISLSGSNAIVSWPGGGFLQSSTNLASPFVDIPSSVSPWTVPLTNSQVYYRVRQ
jgi:uncharacterized repeat protein (TIGR03803 family)